LALKTFVKASKINNLSDARYFAALEVDYIGFDGLPTSANYIAPGKQLEIAGWLSGPKYCLDVCGATYITPEILQQSEQLGAVEVDMHFLATSKFNEETTTKNSNCSRYVSSSLSDLYCQSNQYFNRCRTPCQPVFL